VFSEGFQYFRIGGLTSLIGITGSAKTFSIEFAFLPNESTESYTFAFEEFRKLGIRPPVMVMDGSDGLKSAADKVYTNMPTLLCTWHINKNVLSKCKGKFGPKKHGRPFMVLGGISYNHQPLRFLMSVGKNSKMIMIMMILSTASITLRTNGSSQVRLSGLLQLGPTSIRILILRLLQDKLKYF
jgi:hypothetical protein